MFSPFMIGNAPRRTEIRTEVFSDLGISSVNLRAPILGASLWTKKIAALSLLTNYEDEKTPQKRAITRSTLTFLRDLVKNNNRDWFGENRSRYDVAKT